MAACVIFVLMSLAKVLPGALRFNYNTGTCGSDDQHAVIEIVFFLLCIL